MIFNVLIDHISTSHCMLVTVRNKVVCGVSLHEDNLITYSEDELCPYDIKIALIYLRTMLLKA